MNFTFWASLALTTIRWSPDKVLVDLILIPNKHMAEDRFQSQDWSKIEISIEAAKLITKISCNDCAVIWPRGGLDWLKIWQAI